MLAAPVADLQSISICPNRRRLRESLVLVVVLVLVIGDGAVEDEDEKEDDDDLAPPISLAILGGVRRVPDAPFFKQPILSMRRTGRGLPSLPPGLDLPG